MSLAGVFIAYVAIKNIAILGILLGFDILTLLKTWLLGDEIVSYSTIMQGNP